MHFQYIYRVFTSTSTCFGPFGPSSGSYTIVMYASCLLGICKFYWIFTVYLHRNVNNNHKKLHFQYIYCVSTSTPTCFGPFGPSYCNNFKSHIISTVSTVSHNFPKSLSETYLLLTVKLSLRLTKCQCINTQDLEQAYVHSFLTLTLGVCEWSVLSSRRLTPGILWGGTWVDPRVRLESFRGRGGDFIHVRSRTSFLDLPASIIVTITPTHKTCEID
jgi:hypothetical protein